MVILSKTVEKSIVHSEIEELIRDYHWMRNELDRLYKKLYGTSYTSERSWGVAQYGDEASLPKGSPGKSQAELKEMDEKEALLFKRIQKIEGKVKALEDFFDYDLIQGELHKVVYDCLLFDRMSMRMIALELGISKDKVRQIKNDIIEQLSQNSQMQSVLQS